jgi:hypothetical protein
VGNAEAVRLRKYNGTNIQGKVKFRKTFLINSGARKRLREQALPRRLHQEARESRGDIFPDVTVYLRDIISRQLKPIFYTMSAEVIHSRLVAILKTA